MPERERWWQRRDPVLAALVIFPMASVPWFMLAVQKQEPWRAAYGLGVLVVGAVFVLVLRKRSR